MHIHAFLRFYKERKDSCASTRQNQQSGMRTHRRLRSAWASIQSDDNLKHIMLHSTRGIGHRSWYKIVLSLKDGQINVGQAVGLLTSRHSEEAYRLVALWNPSHAVSCKSGWLNTFLQFILLREFDTIILSVYKIKAKRLHSLTSPWLHSFVQ